jgi:hypothetical protein
MTVKGPPIGADPRFGVLDIVEIDDEARWRGVVTKVTQHPDGEIRYSVRELTDDPDYMAGKYPEARLRATGETAPVGAALSRNHGSRIRSAGHRGSPPLWR